MADRAKRTQWYVGPKVDVPRRRLVELDATGRYAVEEKHDGAWAMGQIEDGVLTSVESRVGLNWGSSLVGAVVFPKEIRKARLIGELKADLVNDERTGIRRWNLFDVLELEIDGQGLTDWRDEPYVARRTVLENLEPLIVSDRVLLVEQRLTAFTSFYDDVVAHDGEGVVIKLLTSKHRSSNASGKTDDWLRCKPRRSVDYVVVERGFAEKGTPRAELGLFKDDKLVRVMATTVPRRCREAAVPGAVVELIGQEIFPSGAIRFGEMQRVRDDKLAEDCTYEAALSAAKIHG